MPHTNNKEVERIATGFESFLSFFSGLPMTKEKDAIKQYEQYIQKYIRTTLHQELQKARESERARIEDEFAKVAKYTQDFEPDAYGENPVNTSYYQLYEGQWEYIIKPKDQSELDQPK